MQTTYSTKQVREMKKGIEVIKHYLVLYKQQTIPLLILGVIIALFEGFVPYILGQFFDALINPQLITWQSFEVSLVWILLGVFIVVQLASNIFSYFQDFRQRTLGENIWIDWSVESFSRVIRKTQKFHSSAKTGKNISALDRARHHIASIVGGDVPSLGSEFLSVVVGVVICMYINIYLGMVILLGIAIYVLLGIREVRTFIPLFRQDNKMFDKAFSTVHDNYSNITEIKRAGTEEQEYKRIYRLFKTKTRSLIGQMIAVWARLSLKMNLTITATRITIFVVSIYLVQNQAITVGELIALNGYAGMLFGPFVRFVQQFHSLVEGVIAIANAQNILAAPEDDYRDKKVPQDNQGLVEFDKVTFSYSAKDGTVLDNISFTTSPGETIALVGKSGAGKSTLIELIGGFYFPKKGRVLIDGVSTRSIDLTHLRRSIAYVSQEVSLFNDTVAANISYGVNRKVSKQEIVDAAKKAYCHEFIKKFSKGYQQIVGERGVKLSVGQKQRIAIARALLRNPAILILDEPTSALDSESEEYITQSLETVMQGRTTFIIAHRLSTVRQANRILVMDEGKIIEEGSHEVLMKKTGSYYKELYNKHVGLH